MAHESPPTEFVSALQLGWKQQRHISLQETGISAAQPRRCFAWWEEDEKQEHAHSGRPHCLAVEGTPAALDASENTDNAMTVSMRRRQIQHFEIVEEQKEEQWDTGPLMPIIFKLMECFHLLQPPQPSPLLPPQPPPLL